MHLGPGWEGSDLGENNKKKNNSIFLMGFAGGSGLPGKICWILGWEGVGSSGK